MNPAFPFVFAASTVWATVNRIARFARDRGVVKTRKLPVRTIGIGNVQAGGAGKTPLTIELARNAIARGFEVAVLSRGYRGEWERSGGVIPPEGPAPSPRLCGDEAALIHDRVPGVWIGVGADRVSQFTRLQTAAKVRGGRAIDLVILDDAFQHWPIQCDLYVVAVTDAPYGERVFREGYGVVSSQDVVVLTKGGEFPCVLRNHPRRVKAMFTVSPPKSDEVFHFVSAIADPARAEATLRSAGYDITRREFFPDHHAFSIREIERMIDAAAAAKARVLLTGKDWMKWRASGIREDAVVVVEPFLRFLEGESIWRALLDPLP